VTGGRIDPDGASEASLAEVPASMGQQKRRNLVSRDHRWWAKSGWSSAAGLRTGALSGSIGGHHFLGGRFPDRSSNLTCAQEPTKRLFRITTRFVGAQTWIRPWRMA
jgi:hypothetical protein